MPGRDPAISGLAVTHRFLALDALRGIAALAVATMHAGRLTGRLLLPRAYLAVDFFFALSGVVIAHAYGAKLAQGMPVRRFFALRLIRLYPLYLLGTLIGIAVAFAASVFGNSHNPPWRELVPAALANILMLPAPFAWNTAHWLVPFNVAGWSLLYEIVVNLLYALCFRWLTPPVLLAVAGVSGALFIGAIVRNGSGDLGATTFTVLPGLVRAVFGFTIGVALYPLIRASSFAAGPWGWLALAAAIAPFAVSRAAPVLVDVGYALVLMPAALFVAARWDAPGGAVLRALGLLSFPLYALHSPLLPVWSLAVKKLGPHAGILLGAPGLLLLLATLVASAFAAERWFDRPVNRALKQALARPGSGRTRRGGTGPA